MAPPFDLLILPLVRAAGHERPEVPGLLAAIQPRRPARFRDHDQLLLYFSQEGSSISLTSKRFCLKTGKDLLQNPGTVTTAQKAVAEALNQYLLDRNLKNASTGKQTIGLLTQIVLRESRLYLAQSGEAHTLSLSRDGAQDIYEPRLAGQGLGISRTTPIHFTMLSIEASDVLVISPNLPDEWTPDLLLGAQGQGPESLRRRLLSKAGADVNAILLQAQPGQGQLRLLRPVRSPRKAPPVSMATQPAGKPPTETGQSGPAGESEPPISEQVTPSEPVTPLVVLASQPDHPLPQTTTSPVTGPAAALPPKEPARSQTQPARSARIGATITRSSQKILVGLGSLVRKILPDESLFSMPPFSMAFFAIAVPLVVVTVSAVVYFQRGRAAQYEVYYTQASEAAEGAATKSDPVELRHAWQTALMYLDQAETYQTTSESKEMRIQAQTALDEIQGIERLDFRPALVDQLAETAIISRVVSDGDDLYLLDQSQGLVLHALLTNEGYQIDPTFLCGPGPYSSGVIIDPLVDIARLPRGNELGAAVMAIDGNGNSLSCILGQEPVASSMHPPDINWKSPQALTIDTGDLYILETQNNAVWIYRDMDTEKPPRLFFGEDIPPMHDVIDLTVNVDDLTLLHEDSHLTTCEYSGLLESPTRCEDPVIFSDPRPGHQSGATISDAVFSEIQFSPPPDPSIYLLDPESQSIYHFSVRLTLQRLYQSYNLPEGLQLRWR
jgi:hypothetical protein